MFNMNDFTDYSSSYNRAATFPTISIPASTPIETSTPHQRVTLNPRKLAFSNSNQKKQTTNSSIQYLQSTIKIKSAFNALSLNAHSRLPPDPTIFYDTSAALTFDNSFQEIIDLVKEKESQSIRPGLKVSSLFKVDNLKEDTSSFNSNAIPNSTKTKDESFNPSLHAFKNGFIPSFSKKPLPEKESKLAFANRIDSKLDLDLKSENNKVIDKLLLISMQAREKIQNHSGDEIYILQSNTNSNLYRYNYTVESYNTPVAQQEVAQKSDHNLNHPNSNFFSNHNQYDSTKLEALTSDRNLNHENSNFFSIDNQYDSTSNAPLTKYIVQSPAYNNFGIINSTTYSNFNKNEPTANTQETKPVYHSKDFWTGGSHNFLDNLYNVSSNVSVSKSGSQQLANDLSVDLNTFSNHLNHPHCTSSTALTKEQHDQSVKDLEEEEVILLKPKVIDGLIDSMQNLTIQALKSEAPKSDRDGYIVKVSDSISKIPIPVQKKIAERLDSVVENQKEIELSNGQSHSPIKKVDLSSSTEKLIVPTIPKLSSLNPAPTINLAKKLVFVEKFNKKKVVKQSKNQSTPIQKSNKPDKPKKMKKLRKMGDSMKSIVKSFAYPSTSSLQRQLTVDRSKSSRDMCFFCEFEQFFGGRFWMKRKT